MKATRKNGDEHEIRFAPIKPYHIKSYIPSDVYGEILVGDDWFPVGLKSNPFAVFVVGEGLKTALGIPKDMWKKDTYILCDDWKDEYAKAVEAAKTKWKEEANRMPFSTVFFEYNTSHGLNCFRTDNEQMNDICDYSDIVQLFKTALQYIKSADQMGELQEYQTGYNYGDYSVETYYAIPVSDLPIIEALSVKGREIEAAKAAKQAEEDKRLKEKNDNIAAGAIYFRCESAPHEEDLTGVLLNRPAPSGGAYLLSHRISNDLFARVKKFAKYYNREFLEDCDMFFSEPGWRFTYDAITELKKTNRVFVDNIEV